MTHTHHSALVPRGWNAEMRGTRKLLQSRDFLPRHFLFAVRRGVAARCEGRTVRVVGFVKKNGNGFKG